MARLVFIGLWCEADREGRMEYRPKRLKATLLPYDDACSMHDLIMELASRGFVRIYKVAGSEYLEVCNFRKHQQPHHKEAASTIPQPSQEDSHVHGKHEQSTAQASVNQSAPCPTDSLIPDSGLLIADSEAPRKRGKHALPDNFKISEGVLAWAKAGGYDHPEASLSYLTNWARGKDKRYADWDAVLRNCIEGDWGDARRRARETAARKIGPTTCCLCPRIGIGKSGDGATYCAEHMPAQDERVAAVLSGIARARAA